MVQSILCLFLSSKWTTDLLQHLCQTGRNTWSVKAELVGRPLLADWVLTGKSARPTIRRGPTIAKSTLDWASHKQKMPRIANFGEFNLIRVDSN